jgi:hypothetical protein
MTKYVTYLEAVKTCEELVVMALIGELWAFISPSRWQESAAHNFTMPARQPDRINCPPGKNVKPQTQSLWALFSDCKTNIYIRSRVTFHIAENHASLDYSTKEQSIPKPKAVTVHLIQQVKKLPTMWDFKFSRRQVWCSELSSGIYCRLNNLTWLNTH